MKTKYISGNADNPMGNLIEANLSRLESVLHSYPKGTTGLVPDAAKDAKYHAAKKEWAIWWKHLQAYNKAFLKANKLTGYEIINGKRIAIYQPKKLV